MRHHPHALELLLTPSAPSVRAAAARIVGRWAQDVRASGTVNPPANEEQALTALRTLLLAHAP